MAPDEPLTQAEREIVDKLRWLQARYPNFKLTIFGQGSLTRKILDMEWSPRIRLSQADLSQVIDD